MDGGVVLVDESSQESLVVIHELGFAAIRIVGRVLQAVLIIGEGVVVAITVFKLYQIAIVISFIFIPHRVGINAVDRIAFFTILYQDLRNSIV